MKPSKTATHEGECGGLGHLQYVEQKAGEKDKGIYKCWKCGMMFSKVVKK